MISKLFKASLVVAFLMMLNIPCNVYASQTENNNSQPSECVEAHSDIIIPPIEESEWFVEDATPTDTEEETWYTEEEYNTFCHLLYAEAGGESDQCIYYVGSVVLNRLNSDYYPDTLLGVIYQKGQYSPTWHGFMSKNIENENVYRIAKDLLDNGSVLPYYVTGQSSRKICNRYDGVVYDVVDGECFWYERRMLI